LLFGCCAGGVVSSLNFAGNDTLTLFIGWSQFGLSAFELNDERLFVERDHRTTYDETRNRNSQPLPNVVGVHSACSVTTRYPQVFVTNVNQKSVVELIGFRLSDSSGTTVLLSLVSLLFVLLFCAF
jgi:hypothetical protein